MYLKRVLITIRAENLQCNIQEVINNHSEIKNYAYILHDKDNTLPHYHIYLDFGNSVIDTKQVADWFGIYECLVRKISSPINKVFRYFVDYGNLDSKYFISDIKTNVIILKL